MAKRTLRELAEEAAAEAQDRAAGLQEKLRDLESQAAEVKAELEATHPCQDRIAEFEPEFRGNLQCPRCWIFKGVHSQIVPIDSDSGGTDLFRCNVCHYEISVRMD